jgi:hypothetical protein
MKNTFLFLVAAFLLSATASAQSTVDSIAAKYKLQPMPEAMTIEKTFPVIGSYQLTTEGAGEVMVSLDSVNKGIVWVEGLPVGKFKAYLKQSPAAYRILSQTTSTGKQIAEGTLLYDATANTLNIAIGKTFNDQNPAEVFALNTAASQATSGSEVEVKVKTKKTKSKSKVIFYSATKSGAAGSSVSSATPVNQ